jgi:putative FmdB family regulatory protein
LPLYEYQCAACGERIEKIQKFSDKPLTECQKCGGKLTKLLSSPAIQFKGSGWYVTDYAKKSSTPSGPTPAKTEEKSKPTPAAPAAKD